MSSLDIEKDLQSILDYEGDTIHHNTFDNIINLMRLYAESVIGEDEDNFFEGEDNETESIRNELRVEQRASIYKQNAEDFRRIK